MRPARASAISALAALVMLGSHGAATGSGTARTFLGATFGLTNADLARAAKGQVVSRTLEAADKREVATFGLVRVKVPPAYYVERLADIATFKRDEAVLQIGAFRHPPALQDVSGLTLDDADIRSLRRCRVGNCGVQLSADAIDRFRQEVDWKRKDAPQRANAVMRQILVDYAAAYARAGAKASMHYADQSEPVDLEREFVSLAEAEGSAWHAFPALRRHVLAFPTTDPRRSIDVLYWSKEKVGRKTVASVTHLAMLRLADDSPAAWAIASKHIYGSHYFDASLGLTVLVPDASPSAPATFVAYVNRSRVDVFGGVFGGIVRNVVTSRARSTVADGLGRLRRTLERDYAALSRTDRTTRRSPTRHQPPKNSSASR